MRRSITAFLAAFILAGCPQAHEAADAGNDAGPGVPERVTTYLREHDRLYCLRAIQCEPRSRTRTYGQHLCDPSYTDSEAYVERVISATQRFDEEAAEMCLAGLRDGYGCVSEEERQPCYRVFVDALPLGAPCRGSERYCEVGLHCDRAACRCVASPSAGEPCGPFGECAENARCNIDNACVVEGEGAPCENSFDCFYGDASFCSEGSCTNNEPEVEPGDPCGVWDDCGPDLWCDFMETGEWTCALPLGLGEDCGLVGACIEGLACIDRFCTRPRAEGERCWRDEECDTSAPFCVGPRFMDGVCAVTPEGKGCSTTPPEYDRGECGGGAFACVPLIPPLGDGFYDDGTCQLRATALGEHCADAALCPDESRCVDGRCVRVITPDMACDETAACPRSHTCDDGRCRVRPTLGEACDSAHPCSRGGCLDGSCRYRPAGSICRTGGECENSFCDREPLDAQGVCTPYQGEGEPCGTLGEHCSYALGLLCAYGLDSAVCLSRCEE